MTGVKKKAKKLILFLVVGIASLGLLIAGCAQQDTGSLLEEVVFSVVESPAAAVLQMQAGEIDLYGFPITDPDLFEQVLDDDNLEYGFNYGGYREIRFNTWGPEFDDGRLNPFAVPEIREAMNWLVDRQHMVDEHLGGLGEPKVTMLGTAFPEHNILYPHIVEEIEEYYAYDLDKAATVIGAEMEKLGATLEDGKWHYDGEPVEIIMLIRSDLPPNPLAGDYVADQLEEIGFTTDRLYRTGTDAAPIWQTTHPSVGAFSVYTGGWSSPTIPRDQGATFDQMYSHRVMPLPLWAVLEEPLTNEFSELNDASRKLRSKEFTTMEEREELFETVLWESLKFSNVVWLMDISGANVHRSDVTLAIDVAGGIGDPGWVFTAHRPDGSADSLRFAVPNLLVSPYNPVEGSAFTYDMFITRRALGGAGFLADPRDGLYWPLAAESAEVLVKEGLPVDATHDWLTLDFTDEIEVPADAWADWDAEKQEFITAAERFGGATTANVKATVTYPKDLFNTPLHDGSTLSMGDFILSMIVTFDRAKEDSPIFDTAELGGFETWMSTFKAVQIVSEDPLIIETYTDLWYMDAEWIVASPAVAWYPNYGTYGWAGYWHMITVGIMAEADRALAFSSNKSDELGVDWMDYTKGPSLPILKERMDKAAEENYIPYAPTLGEFITEDEAAERWSNLQSFYEDWGHFWVGSGPYVLKAVHAVENNIVLERFEDYPHASDRWFFFLDELEIE